MRAALLALLLAVVSGCAALPPLAATPARPEPSAALEGFELRGRVALRTADQHFAGGLLWRRQGQTQTVFLTTPLGQGVAELHMEPSGARLIDAEGRRHEAEDAEALLAALQGWRLPLRGLGHWLVGEPDPAHPYIGERDADGRWIWLEQDGWRIEFTRHDAQGLPGRLMARYDATLEIRLVVDAWQRF